MKTIIFCTLLITTLCANSQTTSNCIEFFKILPSIPIQDTYTDESREEHFKSVCNELEKYKNENFASAKNQAANAGIPLGEVLVSVGLSNNESGWKTMTDYLKTKNRTLIKKNLYNSSAVKQINTGITNAINNCTQGENAAKGLFVYSLPSADKANHKLVIVYNKPDDYSANSLSVEFVVGIDGIFWDGSTKFKRKYKLKINPGRTQVLVTRDSSLFNKPITITAKPNGKLSANNIHISEPLTFFEPAIWNDTVRPIEVTPPYDGPFTYKIRHKTSTSESAGTNDMIQYRLIGKIGQSDWRNLDHKKQNNRERNQTDEFTFVINEDVGELMKIEFRVVKKNGEKWVDDWKVEYIEIFDYNHGRRKYTVVVNKWVGDGKKGKPAPERKILTIKV